MRTRSGCQGVSRQYKAHYFVIVVSVDRNSSPLKLQHKEPEGGHMTAVNGARQHEMHYLLFVVSYESNR